MVKADEILAEGKKQSGDIIGAAEKQSAAIYAQAHRLDPDFYRFWRSMQVSRRRLAPRRRWCCATTRSRSTSCFTPMD